MPDDRLFHKRLGHSEKVCELTDFEDLVWRQFILSADDFGVMRFSAITVQADNDRMARKPLKTVQRALERVRDLGLIRTFQHQGRTYCYQHDWQNHQRVKHPRQTINPKPDDELLRNCSAATQALFVYWPGKRRETFGEDCGNVSETLGHLARARARGTANTNGLRLKASGLESNQAVRKIAHDGARLKVWSWQHDDLGKRLGGKVETFDLLGWYARLEAELARTGESFADPWKWLQGRLYVDADLPMPNLMGKTVKARPAAEQEPAHRMDWWDECQRDHGGACGGQMAHHTRKTLDAAKQESV